MNEKYRKVGITVIVLVVIIALLYLIGFRPMFVVSESMEPNIKKNSIVIVYKESISDIGKNDIICFTDGNGYIVHRVVSKKNNIINTKGDNNRRIDKYDVTPDMIVGKVVFRINFIASIIDLITYQ